jgi:DNA repair protein RadC
MTHDLFFSLDSFVAVPPSSLMVCDRAGEYRPAAAHEVLLAAQRVLAGRVRGSQVLASPTAVRDFLRVRLGGLSHEVFAVVHLDTQFQVLDYVEMFRGTVSQTSVYPREIVKEALVRNTAALLLVHNHPSGAAESLAHQGHVAPPNAACSCLVNPYSSKACALQASRSRAMAALISLPRSVVGTSVQRGIRIRRRYCAWNRRKPPLMRVE